jgi:hypothetical protein
MRPLQILALLLSATVLAPASHAQQFLGPWLNSVEMYVDPVNGVDVTLGGVFSPGTPYQTLGFALGDADLFFNPAGAAVSINLLPGSYSTLESFPISVPAYGVSIEALDNGTGGPWTISSGAATTDAIDITAYFSPTVVAAGGPAAPLPPTNINGLRITGSDRGIHIRPGPSTDADPDIRVEVRDCELDHNRVGIRIEVGENARNASVIEHNRIHTNGSMEPPFASGIGIEVVNSSISSSLIRANRIWENATNVRIQNLVAVAPLDCRERICSNFIEMGRVNVELLDCACLLKNNSIAFATNLAGAGAAGVFYSSSSALGILTLHNNIIHNVLSGASVPPALVTVGPFTADVDTNLFSPTTVFVGTLGNFTATPNFVGGAAPDNLHLQRIATTPAVWGGANAALLRAPGTGTLFDPTQTLTVGPLLVRTDVPVDIDTDPRILQAAGEPGFTPDLGADEIEDVMMTFGPGIDAFGNMILPATGNTIGNVVVSGPVGSFAILLMCTANSMGPVDQNLIFTPFGNALMDPANSTSILSGTVGAGGTINFTLSLANMGSFLEGDVYVQAIVLDPTGNWLTNRLRVEVNL